MKRTARRLLMAGTILAVAVPAQAQDVIFESRPPASRAGGVSMGAALGVTLAAGVALALAGGGGGDDSDNGGDGGAGGTGPDRDDGPSAPDRGHGIPAPDLTPDADYDTPEYRRSWGLDHISAGSKYLQGATGAGTLGAVFDSGIDADHVDVKGKIAFAHDYFSGTDNVTDRDGHGTHVATIMAGRKNGNGAHGVAYDARLAVFRGLGEPGEVSEDGLLDWGDASRKAADLGARVINHSWVVTDDDGISLPITAFDSEQELRDALGSRIMDDLDFAVGNDLVSVFAAGNDTLDQVAVTAGLGVYIEEYRDHMLAVVAIDEADEIADFSNRCGIAADFCLAAPGTGIVAAAPGGGSAALSGSSQAAPHVSGSVLLLASQFPELTGAEITRILRDTARDLGEDGVDSVYGHGALDLANAVAPQGTITLRTSGLLGEEVHAVSDSHISTSGGMTRALASALGARDIVVTDRYDRGYRADMGLFVGDGADATRARHDMADFALGRDSAIGPRKATGISISDAGSAGTSGAILGALDAPYARLIADGVGINAEFGGTTRFGLSSAGAGEDGGYLAASAATDLGPLGLRASIGRAVEDGAFLGTSVSGAFGETLSSTTRFASLATDIGIGKGRTVTLSGALGRTDFDGDGLLERGRGIETSSFGIGYTAADAFRAGDRFRLSASRSLSVEGGSIRVARPTGLGMAVAGIRSRDVEITRNDIDLGAASAPLDLRIGYETPALGGRVALGAAMTPQRRGAGSISAGYRLDF